MPKGTILPYTGLLSDIPAGWHLCDGTDGTPNLIGQFLQGSNIPGSFIDAALPNIKGAFGVYGTSNNWGGYNGPFQMVPFSHTSGYHGENYTDSYGIGFNASLVNSLYKDDCNTVQPPAYTVYYIIKMA